LRGKPKTEDRFIAESGKERGTHDTGVNPALNSVQDGVYSPNPTANPAGLSAPLRAENDRIDAVFLCAFFVVFFLSEFVAVR
jgi:hypothetical protein